MKMYVVSLDEELEKGRGPDKKPRKKKGTKLGWSETREHWSDQKGPMIVAGRYLPESEANAYREDYKRTKGKKLEYVTDDMMNFLNRRVVK